MSTQITPSPALTEHSVFRRRITGPEIDAFIDQALREDLGLGGDLTTNAIFPHDKQGRGSIYSRCAGILAGQFLVTKIFHRLDPEISFEWNKQEGQRIEAGDKIVSIEGTVRALLSGERLALNLMGKLSGIASMTDQYCQRVSGTNARIADTRKTTPLLRHLEKYAVKVGGGVNHRFRLDDGILIKDNHIAMAGGLKQAIKKVKQQCGHMVKIEVEVDCLDQLQELLNFDVDCVLLDNMPPEMLAKAVTMIDGKMIVEASGGVNLETVANIAKSGVDIISVGALTHSAPYLDIGLDIDIS